jgi:DNA-binding NarL/FixJ family response regulator
MDETRALKVVVADDQRNVRSGLTLLLDQEPDVVVVGEAADAPGLLLVLASTAADLLLLDWELPGLLPRQLLHLLRHERPALQIIAMSSRPEARRAALQAGVADFISKGGQPECVIKALRHLFPLSS